MHVKNTAKSKGSNSLWDLFYGNSDDRTTVGTGSGVIVSSDGYIITNNHVIENATEIEITTNDNKSFNAELIGTDKNSDIAVLKLMDLQNFLTYDLQIQMKQRLESGFLLLVILLI